MKIKYKTIPTASSTEVIEWLLNNRYKKFPTNFDNTTGDNESHDRMTYPHEYFIRFDKGDFSVWVSNNHYLVEGTDDSYTIKAPLNYIIEHIKQQEEDYYPF